MAAILPDHAMSNAGSTERMRALSAHLRALVGTDVILLPVPIFQSTRHFEVVTWSPGHGGLLLRARPVESLPPDEPFDRIEVWFKPADVVCLPVHLYGLTVDDAESDARGRITRALGRDLAAWENAYVIGSNDGPAGWLVGGSVNGRADRQAFNAPTSFNGWSVQPGVTELFSHNVH